MKAFEFASPRHEAEILSLLGDDWSDSEVLAGGTDLVGLMKKMIVTPRRVVNLLEVDSMRGIESDSMGVTIGAVTRLDEVAGHPDLGPFRAILDVIGGLGSMQNAAQGTVGGELFHRPRCWYFRNGQGLLAQGGRAVARGENRYHAIFGNGGAARFVSASRLAPALIALDAFVRVLGPTSRDERMVALEDVYRIPRGESQREYLLTPRQVVTHVRLPSAEGVESTTYEIKHGVGPEPPLAAASVAVEMQGGIVTRAKVVLGQVAPIPWLVPQAAEAIVGKAISPETARKAGEAAVSGATPLSDNAYKVQLARVAVERALLAAVGLPTGGFERASLVS
jgi:xanthine dehydrogenase YagS FAD-binding subunit